MSSVIYFVRSTDGLVKIGTTKNLNNRLADLRSQHGVLDLLGVIDGGHVREKVLHWCFGADRIKGEWFEPTEELLSLIDKYAIIPKVRVEAPVKHKANSLKSSFNTSRLIAAIESAGISQVELDRRLGVQPGMTNKYSLGIRTPMPEQLYRFLTALGWTDEQLKQERLVDWYSINGS